MNFNLRRQKINCLKIFRKNQFKALPLKLLYKFTALLIFGYFNCSNSFALSVQNYLLQVQEQNVGYQSSQNLAKSADVFSGKAALLTAPNLFVEAKNGFEKQNQAVTFVRYSQLNSQNYAIGVEKDFLFGLQSKFYYNVNRNQYQNINAAYSAVPLSYQTNPVLQLNFPLWQGFMGSQIKAKRDQIYHQNQADKLKYQAGAKQILVDAEKAYWALVVKREIVAITTQSFAQARRILSNNIRKSQMNLQDKGDVLQARADFESKNLQLKQAQNDERIAARNFNQKRQVNSNVIDEKLSKIDFPNLERFTIKNEMEKNRIDVEAEAEILKTAIAAAKIEEESNKPKLDLSAQYGFNGLEYRTSQALGNSFARNGEEAYVGIKFSMPLAVGLQNNIKKAAKNNASSSISNYRQKVFDQENDWQILLQNLRDYQNNLKLTREIEKWQKAKLENQRYLLKQGRSSLYQVLLFEQDYNQARINVVKTAEQLLILLCDIKLYRHS